MTEVKWSEVKVAQLCPTLCDPMDSTVHGILQARILKWVGLSLLTGIFPTQGWNPGLPHCGWILYKLSHKGNKWQIYCLNYVSAWIVTIFAEQHGRPSEHLPVFQVHAPLQDLSRVLCLLFLWRPEHFASPTVTAGSHHITLSASWSPSQMEHNYLQGRHPALCQFPSKAYSMLLGI